MSSSNDFLVAMVNTFKAITTGRVFSACGETYTSTLDLSSRVHVGTDPSEGSGLRVSVHAGSKRYSAGGRGIGALTVEQDFHVFGVAPATADTRDARSEAASTLEAHLIAALIADRNDSARIGAVNGDAQILPSSGTADGGQEFERCGVVYMLVTIRWSSFIGA